MKNDIPEIRLSESDQNELAAKLRTYIEEAESYQSTWRLLHDRYLRQYLAMPDFETKNSPWPGACNIIIPLGRVVQDAILSQLHDAMFTNDPGIKVIGMEGRDVANAEVLSLFYGDYVWRQLLPISHIGNMWNWCTCLDGTSAVLPRWSRNRELRRRRDIDLEPETEEMQVSIPGMIDQVPQRRITGFKERIVENIMIRSEERPWVDIVDMNQMFFAPDTRMAANPHESIQYPNCRYYYVVSDLTAEDVYARKHRGYQNIDEKLFATMGDKEQSEQERTEKEHSGTSSAVLAKTTPLVEFYMRLVLPAKYEYEDYSGKTVRKKQKFMDDDGFAEDVVVRYWKRTGKIAQVIPLQRLTPNGRRPHIMNWFNALPNQIYGQGVQSKMKMLNDWMSTTVCQMVDAGTLRNMPWYLYVPHMADIPDQLGLQPGRGYPVSDPRGVQFPRMQGDHTFQLSMLQFAQGWAERDGSVSDQTVGRLPERSANKTFRGMALVQQMANISFGRLASLMSQSYIQLFRYVHHLYMRHSSEDVIFKVTGKRIRLTPDDFQQDLDFNFLINPNRQAETQITQMLYQLMANIPYVQQNPMAVRALAKQLYNAVGNSMGHRNFDEIWPEEMSQGIIMQQQQQIMQQAGAPQPGQPAQMPRMPMPQMSAPSLPDIGQGIEAMVEKAVETDSEKDVKLS